jgi:hypothetical protein
MGTSLVDDERRTAWIHLVIVSVIVQSGAEIQGFARD